MRQLAHLKKKKRRSHERKYKQKVSDSNNNNNTSTFRNFILEGINLVHARYKTPDGIARASHGCATQLLDSR